MPEGMDLPRKGEEKNKTKTIIKSETAVMVMMMGKTIIKERKTPSRNLPVCYLPSLSTANLQTFLGGRQRRRAELPGESELSSRVPAPAGVRSPASCLPPPTLCQTEGPRDAPGRRLCCGVSAHPARDGSREPLLPSLSWAAPRFVWPAEKRPLSG